MQENSINRIVNAGDRDSNRYIDNLVEYIVCLTRIIHLYREYIINIIPSTLVRGSLWSFRSGKKHYLILSLNYL